MHLHLNPVGGLAGDMFCAALLDLDPQAFDALLAALDALAPPSGIGPQLEPVAGVLRGRRFVVRHQAEGHHHHTHYTAIRRLLQQADMQEGVRGRAQQIFHQLAEAEAYIHGVELEQVSFHEVGNWDSIIDIVAAAWLLERLDVTGVSCEPLPLGGGRVHTDHGLLPVPAPATARLLEGMEMVDDGVSGERVTPTGAAILKSLAPQFKRTSGKLQATGYGFGSRELPGIPNCLQASLMEEGGAAMGGDRVWEISFEVDDQSPEDLALGLERIRGLDGVLDLTSFGGIGKQGRMVMAVRILARLDAREQVIRACLLETSSIGLRIAEVARVVLPRESQRVTRDGVELEVKQVTRPDGAVTRKVESRSLREVGDRRQREQMRRQGEGE
jgi:uncharacterized protein (TIGR00299 family) protein